MRYWKCFLCLLAGALALTACNNGDDITDDSELTESERINKFIVYCVSDYYLWESETDWNYYKKDEVYRSYSDHDKLFGEFVYADDRWSALTDDIDALQQQFDGVETTYGYELIGGKFQNSGNIFVIILYVYRGSPAEKAGLKRGDIIVGMNGAPITESNYMELYYSSSISLTLGHLNEMTITEDKATVYRMTAVEMYENPVNKDTVIVAGGKRVGYLCLTSFQTESEGDLKRIFADFKSKGVTDVVLDLRYNGGGYARTAQVLSSILAPSSAVRNKEVYVKQKWNDALTTYWGNRGVDLSERFIDTLSVNMNLNRLYVLTTDNTASASEATIIGLKPYMDVVLVGGTTHGKYCGGYLLSPEDYYDNKAYYSDFSNWGMYLMVYRYMNKNNYPDFTHGMEPTIFAEENYFDMKPFGDTTDPLLATAMEMITGVRTLSARSATATPECRMIHLPHFKIPERLIYTGPMP